MKFPGVGSDNSEAECMATMQRLLDTQWECVGFRKLVHVLSIRGQARVQAANRLFSSYTMNWWCVGSVEHLTLGGVAVHFSREIVDLCVLGQISTAAARPYFKHTEIAVPSCHMLLHYD
jgi:hypothetical protein